jgi:hypothetical protein
MLSSTGPNHRESQAPKPATYIEAVPEVRDSKAALEEVSHIISQPLQWAHVPSAAAPIEARQYLRGKIL